MRPGPPIRTRAISGSGRWFGRHGDFDPAPFLRQVSIPVLAVYDAEDVIVPPAENVERLRGLLANADATIHILPGADHRLEVSSGRDADGRWHWFSIAPGYFKILGEWLRREADRRLPP